MSDKSSWPPRLPMFRSLRLAAATVIALGLLPEADGGDEGRPPAASVYSRRPRAAAAASIAQAAQATGSVASPPAGVDSDAASQAERIVASSLASIARAESVSIKLRQRVRIGDRVLVGTGRYLQAGQGEEQRFRFETALTCETESFEMTEVNDGLFCWLHRRIGPDPPALHRIDVQRVRGRLEELGAVDPADTAAYLGGLQRSLAWVRQWFRFSEAVTAEVDGRPVWMVEGRWLPETLPMLMPAVAEAAKRPEGVQPADLPDGVPWIIRFAVGRSDLLLHRVEYLAIPGQRPVSNSPLEVITAIEFLEIEFDVPIDATAFYYQPADEELIDLTGFVVKTMGLLRP